MSTRSHRMDRRALFASGAAAALLAATGVSAQALPTRGGRLRVALSGATRGDSFDLRGTSGTFMQVAALGCVFDTLTEVAADGTLRGELATAWQGSADAREWIFDLRRDVQFHNGAAFTARDVVASFDLHRDGALSDVAAITALGPHRVHVSLNQPNADLPLLLSQPPFILYPADHMAEAMMDGIGTGLYRVERFQPGRDFLGTRVARHYKNGQAGWFDTVELVSVTSDTVRAEALRDGYVDAADITDAAEVNGYDLALLPDEKTMTHAANRRILMPTAIGSACPLDNLRGTERWWMG